MTISILVCEDDPTFLEEWIGKIVSAISGVYRVLPPPSNDRVREGIRELLRRRSLTRDGSEWVRNECVFDGADILVIDYDLIHIDEDQARHTGESVARLARSFSDCLVAVVLNQFPGSHFDLSLRGHFTSHAELNIDAEFLSSHGLWNDPPWRDEFRPWSWHTLYSAATAQAKRTEAILGALDTPITEFFGMRAVDMLHLSDTAFGFIAPEANSFAELERQTFRSFLGSTSDRRDAQALVELFPVGAARFITSRISKWLEVEVLGPQDVLIDLPHLIQRYPFLIGDAVGDVDRWNAAVHDVEHFRREIPMGYWFAQADWLSKPAVWWQRLEFDAGFGERRANFDYTEVPEVVFLEDCSVFCEISEATEFRAGFHNSYDRRYVRNIEGIRYSPQRRFAFGS